MQPEKTQPNSRAVAAISGILLAIILLVAYLVFVYEEDEGDETGTPSGSGQIQGGTQYPVTIIIIDDFSRPLMSLVERVAPPDSKAAGDFRAAAEQVRSLSRDKGEDGEYLRGQVSELMGSLKAEVAETVLSSEEMNLGERAAGDTNCAVTPEGTAAFVTEGTAAFVTEGTGAFVTEGTTAFVTEGTTAFVTEGTSLWDQPHGQRIQLEFEEMLRLPEAQGLDIRVRVLEADGFVFPELAAKLDQMVAEVRAEDPNMRIVVNMSFAMVPCEKVTDIVAYTRLLREFVIEEGGSDPTPFSEVIGALYAEDVFHTPLKGEGTFQSEFCPGDEPSAFAICAGLEEQAEVQRTIYFVGASGNGLRDESGTLIGVDFPFFPAAWGEVIAISANNDSEHLKEAAAPRAEYSNAGRIIMGGTWPPDPATWTAVPDSLDQFPQAGTSFAAPRYSFIVALYLAGAQGIDVGCGPDVIPPPADPVDWLAAPPPPDKTDQGHCSTLQP